MSKNLYPNVKVLLITCGFLSLAMGIVYPFLSEYIYSITGSVFTAGLVASVRSAVCAFFLILGGYLTDIVGRKKPIWIGTILLGLSQLVYAFAKTPLSFLAAALCEGVSFFYFPAFNAMIMDSAPSYRMVRVFTLVLVADHLPYAISPIFGGVLRDSYGIDGLRFGFGFSGLTISVLGIVRSGLLSETVKETKKANVEMLTDAYKHVIRDFRSLNPIVKKLILLRSFSLLVGISMFHYFAVLYAVRYTEIVSFTEWGLIMALSSAFYLFALPLAGFVERFGLASPYAFLIFLEGVAALIFLLNEKPALFVSMILLNICGALTYAIERSVVARITEQLMRGRAETFMNLSFYSGMALGSYIGGLVYTWYPPFFIILTSTLLTIGAVFGFVIFRGLKQG